MSDDGMRDTANSTFTFVLWGFAITIVLLLLGLGELRAISKELQDINCRLIRIEVRSVTMAVMNNRKANDGSYEQ